MRERAARLIVSRVFFLLFRQPPNLQNLVDGAPYHQSLFECRMIRSSVDFCMVLFSYCVIEHLLSFFSDGIGISAGTTHPFSYFN